MKTGRIGSQAGWMLLAAAGWIAGVPTSPAGAEEAGEPPAMPTPREREADAERSRREALRDEEPRRTGLIRMPELIPVPTSLPTDWSVPGRMRFAEWWEHNRTRYLLPDTSIVRSVPAADRAAGLAALRELLNDPGGEYRGLPFEPAAFAAVALARAGDDASLPRLLELAGDPRIVVRRAAWAAIGVLGSPGAREFLFRADVKLAPEDELCRAVAIGLLPDATPAEVEQAQRYFRDTSHPEVRRMLAWALRMVGARPSRDLMRHTLERTDDPLLAAEAMLALAAVGLPEDEEMIAAAFRNTSDRLRPPVFERINQLIENVDHDQRAEGLSMGHVGGSRPIYAWDLLGLRSTAAVALGRFVDSGDDSAARRALRDPFEKTRVEVFGEPVWYYPGASDWWFPPMQLGPNRKWNTSQSVERRLGLVSLGWLAKEDKDVELLVAVFDRKFETPYSEPFDLRFHAPLREFATLGMGAFMHRAYLDSLQPPSDRWGRDELNGRLRDSQRLARNLIRLVKDRAEDQPPALRATAAIAVGLTYDPAHADALAEAVEAQKDRPIDDLVTAYGALALGMLRDGRAVPAARHVMIGPRSTATLDEAAAATRLFQGTSEGLRPDARLAMRAAALGVGLSGKAEGRELLWHMLGVDHYLDLDLVRALKWLDDQRLLPLMNTLAAEPNLPVQQRTLVAWAIGELLDPRPHAATEERFQRDANPMLPLYRTDAKRISGYKQFVPGYSDAPIAAFTASVTRTAPPQNGAYAMFGYLGNEFLWDAWIEGGRRPDSALGQSYRPAQTAPPPATEPRP